MTFGGLGVNPPVSDVKSMKALRNEAISPDTIEEDLERDDDYDFLIDQVIIRSYNHS